MGSKDGKRFVFKAFDHTIAPCILRDTDTFAEFADRLVMVGMNEHFLAEKGVGNAVFNIDDRVGGVEMVVWRR